MGGAAPCETFWNRIRGLVGTTSPAVDPFSVYPYDLSRMNAAEDVQSPCLLRMEAITKSFDGVEVLHGVDFELAAGEVHVLAGENGAGKSTLMNILAGSYQDYQGRILIGNSEARFRSAAAASRRGISMIHQELSLIPSMSVIDNVFLGRETVRHGLWVDRQSQQAAARGWFERLGVRIDLARPVDSYPVSIQQMVEVVKALVFDSQIIIMDEPTSALSQPEVERLFDVITDLKRMGRGVIYITHRMEEMYRIADRITVLRDGRHTGSSPRDDLPRSELIRWMVGREITRQFPQRAANCGDVRLRVMSLSLPTAGRGEQFHDVSFDVHAGEILGIGGLEGAGNHGVLRSLFGCYGRRCEGEVLLDGRPFNVRDPRRSIAAGLVLLTNDRKAEGLVPIMQVSQNITLASVPRYSPRGWLAPAREQAAATRAGRELKLRFSSAMQPASSLSGGNQQKLVLGKWVETQPRVMLLDEPTRGVDVGAKKDVYDLMNQWTSGGIAIVLITSEMPELLAMADRILVMHRGRVTAELSRNEATQESVLRAAMGVEDDR